MRKTAPARVERRMGEGPQPRLGHRRGRRTMTGEEEGRRKRKRVGEDGARKRRMILESESDEEQGGSGEVGRSERIRLRKGKSS